MSNVTLDEGLKQKDSVSGILDSAIDAGGGLLRLTPTWVPRSHRRSFHFVHGRNQWSGNRKHRNRAARRTALFRPRYA